MASEVYQPIKVSTVDFTNISKSFGRTPAAAAAHYPEIIDIQEINPPIEDDRTPVQIFDHVIRISDKTEFTENAANHEVLIDYNEPEAVLLRAVAVYKELVESGLDNRRLLGNIELKDELQRRAQLKTNRALAFEDVSLLALGRVFAIKTATEGGIWSVILSPEVQVKHSDSVQKIKPDAIVSQWARRVDRALLAFGENPFDKTTSLIIDVKAVQKYGGLSKTIKKHLALSESNEVREALTGDKDSNCLVIILSNKHERFYEKSNVLVLNAKTLFESLSKNISDPGFNAYALAVSLLSEHFDNVNSRDAIYTLPMQKLRELIDSVKKYELQYENFDNGKDSKDQMINIREEISQKFKSFDLICKQLNAMQNNQSERRTFKSPYSIEDILKTNSKKSFNDPF